MACYDQDGLRSIHNHEFMDDPAFRAAYNRGIQAAGFDFNWHWRVHVGLWAARCAAKLDGDFVECGVGKGFLSSAIMQALGWNSMGRTFWLLDTFSGIDERYVTKAEIAEGIYDKNREAIRIGIYTTTPEPTIRNFAEWRNVEIIIGSVPETLGQISAKRVAYLHLDMNCAPPEIAAITHLWSRFVDGAFILLDDYAYHGYRQQKLAIDAFAAANNVAVLSMPTGQGLIIKPPSKRWFDRLLRM